LLLRKYGIKNYFIALLLLLSITTILIVAAFVLTAVFPDSLGRSPYQYETGPLYEFEPWLFEVGDLKVSFPQGGLITSLHESERKRSLLLLGEGFFESNGQKFDSVGAGGLFMVIEHDLFDLKRGSNIFTPVEDIGLIRTVEDIAALQKGIPSIWKDTIPLTFHAQEDLVYYYFITPEGVPIFPPQTNGSPGHFIGTLLIYVLIIIIMLFILTILSPDHRYSRYWIHLGRTPPGAYSLAMIPFIAAILLGTAILVNVNDWPDYYNVPAYIAVIAILYLSSIYGKIDYLDLGLRRDRIRHGYLMSLIAGLSIVIVKTGIPDGLDFAGSSSLLSFATIFFLTGLPREMIWRGYIQAVLSRQFNPTRGLLAMILIAALVHYIYLITVAPWMIDYPYTYLEALILTPGMAAILGYLYLRTENIVACALLHSLILWLPGIIIY
jgi:membrane protease YdiL (CAAX protease family)